jgi:hypothetical protein
MDGMLPDRRGGGDVSAEGDPEKGGNVRRAAFMALQI